MTDFRQETDADLDTPPADAGFRPAAPLKDAGVEFTADDDATDADAPAGDDPTVAATRQVRETGNRLVGQATDQARAFADQGKAAAGDKLDQVAQMLTDAAQQVDDKLGGQYGQYARDAADRVSGFSNAVRNKDVDELVEDVRGFVRASPAVAIGIAAAAGFAIARVIQSGIEASGGDDRS